VRRMILPLVLHTLPVGNESRELTTTLAGWSHESVAFAMPATDGAYELPHSAV